MLFPTGSFACNPKFGSSSRMLRLSERERDTIHGLIVSLRKSSRMMTSLSRGEFHNNTTKRIGFDPHIMIDEVVTLKWCPSRHKSAKTDECHDVTEEDGASSNTPKRSSLKLN